VTAIRVVSDHFELDNIGTVTHPELDEHVLDTQFVVTSASVHLPSSARRLLTGSGIVLIDDPFLKTLTVSVDTNFVKSLFVFQEVPSGAIDGLNATFLLAHAPSPSSSLLFFVNGVLQAQGVSSDYVLSGSTVSMAYAPRASSNIFATYPRS